MSDTFGYPHGFNGDGNGICVVSATNADRFISRLSELALECVKTAERKNHDYASKDDPFANFRAVERLGLTVEDGLLTRMSDKLCRVGNLLKQDAAVKDERVEDTLSDLANYALILRVWLEWRGEIMSQSPHITRRNEHDLCPHGCGAPLDETQVNGHYECPNCHSVTAGCCGDI